MSKGTRRHTIKLDEAQQRVVTLCPTVECAAFLGRSSRAAAVSESGLYKLIMRSDKDTARPFQDWVTKEVLPAIRKTGGYLLNEAAREKAHADTRSAMPLPEEFIAGPWTGRGAARGALKMTLRQRQHPD